MLSFFFCKLLLQYHIDDYGCYQYIHVHVQMSRSVIFNISLLQIYFIVGYSGLAIFPVLRSRDSSQATNVMCIALHWSCLVSICMLLFKLDRIFPLFIFRRRTVHEMHSELRQFK